MKEALYYRKIKDNYVHCNLCPHYCRIKDGELGICNARQNIDGSLYTLNYGKITSYGYDKIEKKPLFYFHPGSEIFSIGTFGCNLTCDYCQNWRIAHKKPAYIEVSDEEMIKLAKAKGSIGVAFTYNEPSIWYEYILHLSKLTREEGLVNVLVTNGYINPKPLAELLPYIDAMNIDLKSISEEFYNNICGGQLAPVLKTIEMASKSVHLEVSTLLVGGKNTNLKEIELLAKTISEIDSNIPLHLNRYFPAYKMDLPATELEIIFKARDISKKYLKYVYTGNIF